MDLLLHIIFIKFLGWIDNSIKFSSYFVLFYFIVKLIYKYIYKKITIKKELGYYSIFFVFIILFIGNFFIFQSPLNTIYLQTFPMYVYNFFISMLFFLIYKEVDYLRIIKVFTFYLIIVFFVDFIFMYDFFTNYSIGFIHHIEKNVATVYYGRGAGFFSDPTASSTVILLFPIILFSVNKYFKVPYFKVYFLIGLISIIISTSKLSILLYIYEIILLYLLSSKKQILAHLFKTSIYLIFLFVILISIVSYLYFIDIKSIVQMVDFFIDPSSAKTLTERIYTYNIALEIINDNILVGIGAGNPQALIGLSIHNTILQNITENGLIGLAFILYFYFIFPYLIFKSLKYTYLKYVYFIWFHIFFIKSMFVDVMHTHMPIIYFLGIGILYNLNYLLKGKNEKNFIYKWKQ